MAGLGVDGCKGGWLYFRLDGPEPQFGVVPSLAQVMEVAHPGDVVLADVPMGLPEGPDPRRCDVAARRQLGPSGRASSVFPLPCRAALDAGSYEEASRVNEARTGRRLSRQSWALAPRIREADALRGRPGAGAPVLREAHPELVFWGLTGGSGMPFSKKTREGFLDRLAVLEEAYPGAEELAARAFVEHGGFRVYRDDVVDALACAVAAVWSDNLRSVPPEPPTDARGIPMEIVYAHRPVWTGPLPSQTQAAGAR